MINFQVVEPEVVTVAGMNSPHEVNNAKSAKVTQMAYGEATNASIPVYLIETGPDTVIVNKNKAVAGGFIGSPALREIKHSSIELPANATIITTQQAEVIRNVSRNMD